MTYNHVRKFRHAMQADQIIARGGTKWHLDNSFAERLVCTMVHCRCHFHPWGYEWEFMPYQVAKLDYKDESMSGTPAKRHSRKVTPTCFAGVLCKRDDGALRPLSKTALTRP